jgi:dipeptide/tripeptide permease
LGDPETNKANAQVETAPVQPLEPIRRGHPKAFWFFFWGEFAERCSYYGMRAILALYMTDKLGINKADSGTYMSFFIAACYFLPLLGGWIADNYLGKYWTIVSFSIPYVVGQVLVGVPDRWFLFLSLCLLAMGSGVIKPNISTLMGLTYDQQRPGQAKLRTDAFSLFYMAINVGALLSQVAMPLLRDRYGYRIAFLFPAVFMTLALSVFALGKNYYAKEVIVRRSLTEEEKELRWKTLGSIAGLFVLVMFFWSIFDQSASTWIFFADTYMDTNLFGWDVSADLIQSFNPLFIIIFLPLVMLLWRMLDRWGIRVRATDKMIVGFGLTAVTMGIMGLAGFLAGPLESRVRLEAADGTVEFTKGDVSFREGSVQMPDGKVNFADGKLAIADQATVRTPKGVLTVSAGEARFKSGQMAFKDGKVGFKDGTVEFADGVFTPEGGEAVSLSGGKLTPSGAWTVKERKAEDAKGKALLEEVDYVRPENRVSVWWQVLAYLMLTLAEILISVTGLELAFVAAPASMKSFVTACWLLTVGMANLFINASITRLYPTMPPGVYFLLLAATVSVVGVAFVFMAGRFNRAMAEKEARENSEAQTEAR